MKRKKTKPRAVHCPQAYGQGAQCGAKSAELASTAALITCKTCLGWPGLIAHAFGEGAPK